MIKDLNYYLSLKYPVEIVIEENGYFAEIPLLEGCMTQAHTLEDLLCMIQDAKKLWLQWAIDHKKMIPTPDEQDTVTIPKFLKSQLKEKAAKENKTLHEYLVEKLVYLS